MIDFDDEIKKFKESLEIGEAEKEILKNDMTDVADIIERLMENKQPVSFGTGKGITRQ